MLLLTRMCYTRDTSFSIADTHVGVVAPVCKVHAFVTLPLVGTVAIRLTYKNTPAKFHCSYNHNFYKVTLTSQFYEYPCIASCAISQKFHESLQYKLMYLLILNINLKIFDAEGLTAL